MKLHRSNCNSADRTGQERLPICAPMQREEAIVRELYPEIEP